MGKPTRSKSKNQSNKPVFYFLVEGESEEAYIGKLKSLFSKSGKIENSKGGSAKAVLENAEKIYEKLKDEYSAFVIWFDKDHTYNSTCTGLIQELISKSTQNLPIYIICSNPVIEHWLLIHYDISNKKNCNENNVFYEKSLKDTNSNYKKGSIGELSKDQICSAWSELSKFIQKVQEERSNDVIEQCFPLDFETNRDGSYQALHNYFCS